MLNFKYISSRGNEYDLLTDGLMFTECNAFDYEQIPVTFGKRFGAKIYGFEMDIKAFEAVIYFYGANRADTINALTADFDYDLLTESPGTFVCNGYEIQGFSVGASESSNNSSSLLWDTVKRKFICPYPFWSKQTYEHEFNEDEEPITSGSMKDYLPVSSNGKADYNFDLLTVKAKEAYFENTALIGSKYILKIHGPVVSPVITIGDIVINLDISILTGQTVTIDSRTKTIMLHGTDNLDYNIYGYRDVSVDIFKLIPYGLNKITWNGNFKLDLALYDERMAPLWN